MIALPFRWDLKYGVNDYKWYTDTHYHRSFTFWIFPSLYYNLVLHGNIVLLPYRDPVHLVVFTVSKCCGRTYNAARMRSLLNGHFPRS